MMMLKQNKITLVEQMFDNTTFDNTIFDNTTLVEQMFDNVLQQELINDTGNNIIFGILLLLYSTRELILEHVLEQILEHMFYITSFSFILRANHIIYAIGLFLYDYSCMVIPAYYAI